ncbi:hypothetical protein [Alsobacter sp. SYSU BS001988]
MKYTGLSTEVGHESQVFEVLRSELEEAGSSISNREWDGMCLSARGNWLRGELERLQSRIQHARAPSDDTE